MRLGLASLLRLVSVRSSARAAMARVVVEELVEVAEAEEEQRVGVLRLRRQELPHDRRRAGGGGHRLPLLRASFAMTAAPSEERAAAAIVSVLRSTRKSPSDEPSTTASMPSGATNIDDWGTTAVVCPSEAHGLRACTARASRTSTRCRAREIVKNVFESGLLLLSVPVTCGARGTSRTKGCGARRGCCASATRCPWRRSPGR